MSRLDWNVEDGVAMVRMNNGATNPIDMEMARELRDAVHRAADDPEVRSLVLAGANQKFFSIGFDLPHWTGPGERDFAPFFRFYNELCLDLFSLPKPTVAALEGHAVAGGFILATCCDSRILAEGKKLMGMNEIKLGVPVPYTAERILRSLAGPRTCRLVMEEGGFYPPEQAYVMELVDQVVPLERVLPAAVAKARFLGEMPEGAFALFKRNRVHEIAADIRAHSAQSDLEFLERWIAPATRERLKLAAESMRSRF